MRLIDADALMEVIKSNDYMLVDICNTKDFGMYTIGIQQAVDEQSTIEPITSQWTSVADGLPSWGKHNRVLVTLKNEMVLECFNLCSGFKAHKMKSTGGLEAFSEDNPVTHWMPLPEPPREEKV